MIHPLSPKFSTTHHPPAISVDYARYASEKLAGKLTRYVGCPRAAFELWIGGEGRREKVVCEFVTMVFSDVGYGIQ